MLTKTQYKEAAANLYAIRHFVPLLERKIIAGALEGEEGEYFAELIAEVRQRVEQMPSTGETDGQGDGAIAHLHYFHGGADWFITEKDVGVPGEHGEQLHAFGWAEILPGCGEYGYISLAELSECGVELDLHWRPRPVRQAIEDRGR